MAVNTTAGSTLAISSGAPVTYDAAGFAALTYTVIGEITDLGEFGREYNIVTHNPIGERRTKKLKGSFNEGTLPLQFGRDFSDVGQTALRAASQSDNPYSMVLTSQTGRKFYFTGLVASYKTNFGSVDSITSGSAMVEIQTEILEVA